MKRVTDDSVRGLLTDFVRQSINMGVDAEKTRQYYDIRRSNLYYSGKQYLVAQYNAGYMDWVPVDQVLNPRSNQGQAFDEFDDTVVNVYRGDVRKAVAVLGQKPPNVNCVAASPQNSEHQRRAKTADFISHHLDDIWDVPYKHMLATWKLMVNSTVYFYTPWSVDQDTYGVQKIPQFAQREVEVGPGSAECPDCGWMGDTDDLEGTNVCPQCFSGNVQTTEAVTMEVEEETGEYDVYARGGVACHVLSGLEVTTPFYITCLSEAPWLRYECEMDRGILLSYYPWLLDKIRSGAIGGLSGDIFGSTTRMQAQSYSKATILEMLGKRLPYTRYWIRTSQYGLMADPDYKITVDGGMTVPFVDWLYREFPDGMKLCFVGDWLVTYDNERLDDVWAAAQPEADETMNPPAYMSDMIEAQDRINDFSEQAHQSIERSLSSTIADPQVLNPKSVNQIGRRAAQFIFSTPGAGGRFDSAFYKLAASEPRPEIFAYGMQILDTYREITGVRPEIFGASSSETLGEAEMNRNQALMVFGLPWFFLRRGWAKAKLNGIKQVARHSPDGRLYYPIARDAFGEGVELPADYKELLKGGWWCQADESMPMTVAQIRTWMERMMTSENPELPGRLGMFHPDNLGRMNDVMGIPEWTIPEHKDREAVIDVVRRLSQAEPMMDVDPMTGQPTEMPTEQPDPYLHNPMFAAQVIREWLTSEEGQKLQAQAEGGWRNVYLYGRQLFDMTQAPPASSPDGGPAPEGEGGAQIPPPSPDLVPQQSEMIQ